MSNSVARMVIVGLNSASTSVSPAGVYSVDCKINLPQLSEGSSAPSQVVAVISQNGSPMYTGFAGAEGAQISLNCADNDLITVALSSSAAIDQGTNVIKATVSIG